MVNTVLRFLNLVCLLSFISSAYAGTPSYGLLSDEQRTLAERLRPSVQQHLAVQSGPLGLGKKDITEWEVSDISSNAGTQCTYVYVQQTHAGIRVFNAVSPFSLRDGEVLSFASRFVQDLARKVNTTRPVLSPTDAIRKAAAYLGIDPPDSFILLTDIPSLEKYIYAPGNLSTENLQVTLFLLPVEEEVRLVWNVNIAPPNSTHWWNLRFDAVDGRLLDKNDWTVSCDFGAPHPTTATQPMTSVATSTPSARSSSSLPTYEVYAFPLEAPSFGSRTILTNPADPAASPYGWHDTNGQPGDEFTTTQGNNVHAYDDIANNNAPGTFADGGASMNFNFPVNLSQAPSTYLNASITNLFYVNNWVHDVLYHYGLDEAGGNFQQTNYTGQGAGNDYVEAECQDGGGTNNANFATPDDGMNGRMQMYLWSGATASTLQINSPAGIAGNYTAIEAGFGPGITVPITADLVLVDDGVAPATDACDPIQNAAALSGKIAVIDRGTCTFISKVTAAQNAGAIAVIVCNNQAGSPISMGGTGTTSIPAVMISQADGAVIKAAIAAGAVNGTLQPPVTIIQDLDGSFDNGIVAHEYGHGVSNRLTGGPNNSNCLNNGEQGGEGWSDWFSLMYTIEPGDNGTDARGIGTYAVSEPVTGSGIRRYPYSTDMSVNPQTYADLAVSQEVHDIGEIWCVTLWDLTWALIAQSGFDPDWINGTGGNNIALRLVMEGMKLQPCGPGFLDGRDAILAADNNLYGGAHRCMIWEVFARRGMGANALQGSASNAGDETADFTVPSFCQTPTVAPTAAFSADVTTTCYGTVRFTDQSTDIAQTWDWDFGDGTGSQLQNPVHTYTNGGQYTVTLVVSNTIGSDTLVLTNYISVTSPAAPVISAPASVCIGSPVTFSSVVAPGDSTEWYDATGNVLIGTGSTFTTAPLNAPATLQARQYTPTPVAAVGPANTAFGTGNYHNTTFEGKLLFTTLVPVRIVSVLVDASGTAARTFNLYSGSGSLIQSQIINVPAGQSRVTLNFDIPVAGNYEIGVAAGSNLYRNNAGATYPYTAAGLLTITASNSTSNPATFYYYLYDWRVQELPCLSSSAVATVQVEPDPSVAFQAITSGFSVQFDYPSVTTDTSYVWDFGDGTSSNQASPLHVYAQPGTYTVTLTVTTASGCTAVLTQNVTITVSGFVSPEVLQPIIQWTEGTLSIRLPSGIQRSTIVSVYDALGRTVVEPKSFSGTYIALSLPHTGASVLQVRLEHDGVISVCRALRMQ
jgi:PKD repeat protein